jgi:hypothetical protein
VDNLSPFRGDKFQTYPPLAYNVDNLSTQNVYNCVPFFLLRGQCGKRIHSFCGKRRFHDTQLTVANQTNVIIQ